MRLEMKIWICEGMKSPENRPSAFTIADDYDPDGNMSPIADPVTAYQTYLRDVRGGMVGDMGFTVDDFKTHIAGLSKPDWTKIFAICD
jgi:hypothetical protein